MNQTTFDENEVGEEKMKDEETKKLVDNEEARDSETAPLSCKNESSNIYKSV